MVDAKVRMLLAVAGVGGGGSERSLAPIPIAVR